MECFGTEFQLFSDEQNRTVFPSSGLETVQNMLTSKIRRVTKTAGRNCQRFRRDLTHRTLVRFFRRVKHTIVGGEGGTGENKKKRRQGK